MLTVGIIGDFDPASETHRATNEALRQAAHAIDTIVTASWLPTNELHTGAMERALRSFDALWAAPGSPYRDMGEPCALFNLRASGDGRSSAPEEASNMLW
jgi:CTP synthase (UTP-ammonia lyase)